MRCVATLALMMVVLSGPAGVVRADEESGVADVQPWSGYWWAIKQGWMWGEEHPATSCYNLSSEHRDGPLNKYDLLVGSSAAARERAHKYSNEAECWWGYCHAWSAASILEPEPREPRTVRAGGSDVELSVGDQKALLTLCYDSAPADSWGTRWDQEGYDPDDLSPENLWQLLRYHIGENKTPFLLDIEPTREVWNYPVFAYEVKVEPVDNSDRYVGHMAILLASDGVVPDYVGTEVKTKDYYFTCRITGDGVVVGSGEWLMLPGQKEPPYPDHPDFAWLPSGVGISNSEIDYDTVQKIVFGEATRGQPRAGQVSVHNRGHRLEISRGTGPSFIPVSADSLAMLLAEPSKPAELKLEVKNSDGSPAVGKNYSCDVTSEKAGYVYIFNVDVDGNVRVLFPLEDQVNKIEAGKTMTMHGQSQEFSWAHAGKQRIEAVVSHQPLSLGRLEPTAPLDNKGAGRPLHWTPSERAAASDLVVHRPTNRGASSGLPTVSDLIGEVAVAEDTVDVGAGR
jgi:hypothetical protein